MRFSFVAVIAAGCLQVAGNTSAETSESVNQAKSERIAAHEARIEQIVSDNRDRREGGEAQSPARATTVTEERHQPGTRAERIARHEEKIRKIIRENKERRALGESGPSAVVTTVTGEGRLEKTHRGPDVNRVIKQWNKDHKADENTSAVRVLPSGAVIDVTNSESAVKMNNLERQIEDQEAEHRASIQKLLADKTRFNTNDLGHVTSLTAETAVDFESGKTLRGEAALRELETAEKAQIIVPPNDQVDFVHAFGSTRTFAASPDTTLVIKMKKTPHQRLLPQKDEK